MSNMQIPNLPAVTALSGAELFEGVQSGSSVKISLGQILAAAANGTPVSLPIPIADGGTGATTAPVARTNLGLGTIAIQDANSVVITGGSINGTSIGGTTASTGTFTTGTFGLGAVGTPSITFTGDLDTGIWSPGANQVSISTAGVQRFAIDASGNASLLAAASEVRSLQIGEGRTGNGSSFIDLIGDPTYTDYGARFSRDATAVGSTSILHRGIGSLSLIALDAGAVGISTSNTQRVLVTATGSVGIGTNNPTSELQVNAATGTVDFRLSVGEVPYCHLFASAASTSLYSITSQPLTLGTANAERMRILSTGEVGIGTATPLSELQVNAAATDVSVLLSVADVTYGNLFASSSSTALFSVTALPLVFGTTNTERFRIGAGGQWGIAGANYGTSGQAIVSAGAAAAPAWGTVGLNGGGTGATSAPAAAAALYGYTSTPTAAGTTVLTNTSSQYQLFTGVTTQIITLPVTSTLTTGWTFHIVNASTGNLTVNSSGANLVATVPANMTLMVTCIGTALTTAADWEWGFTDFGSVTGTGSVVLSNAPTVTSLTATTSVLSTGAGGIGYATGAGVAVTQLTSRTTPAPTTGNKTSGSITLFSAAGVAGWTSFTVPNTAIAITDTVILTVRGNTNTYVAAASTIIAGTSFVISFNAVAGVAVDAPTINFNIIRGVNA